MSLSELKIQQAESDQDRILNELIEISEHLVKIAKEKNAIIVLPGRSLVACAYYIEKKFPETKVICMPMSDTL